MSSTNWLEVDRKGLAQLIEDKPKVWILFELIQNALDEDTTKIDVTVESCGKGQVEITVTDDSPDGYHDLKHAWTLYAPSKKKQDPTLRGRFNIGCKMVLVRRGVDSSDGLGVSQGPPGSREILGSIFCGKARSGPVVAVDCPA